MNGLSSLNRAVMSDDTVEYAADLASGRIEIVCQVSDHRRSTVDKKLAILRDVFGADGAIGAVVERHESGSGAIYTWQRR